LGVCCGNPSISSFLLTSFQPKLPKNHFLNNFFLDKEQAINIPLILLAGAVLFLFAFLTKFYLKEAAKKKK